MELPHVDPRIRRTRAALHGALARLLRDRSFEDISLLEVAEAADLNRATIYKHYADKVALLDAMIADDLRTRFWAATTTAAPTGTAKLVAIVEAVFECARWIATLGRADDRLLRPIAEARMRTLLQTTVEFALDEKIVRAVVDRELAAAMASAAICGAAAVYADGAAKSDHVARTIEALSSLIVGSARMPKLTRGLEL